MTTLRPISAFEMAALVSPTFSAISLCVKPACTRNALMYRPIGSSRVTELWPNARNSLSRSLDGKLKLSHRANKVLRFGLWLPFSISHTVCFDVCAFSASSVCVQPKYARLALSFANDGPKSFCIFAKIYLLLVIYRSQF